MAKKNGFFDLDKTQIAKGKQVPDTNITDTFVNASHNGDRVLNGFMSVELPEKDLTLRKAGHKKAGTTEKMCKKECKGCKMRLDKETSNIVS